MTEQKYTLEEARRQLEILECQRYGHSFTILEGGGSPDPAWILCDRCGRTWEVAPSHDPVLEQEC